MTPSRRFAEFQDTPLWHTLAAALDELVSTREIEIGTAPEYVVGYLCERLVSTRAVVPTALQAEP